MFELVPSKYMREFYKETGVVFTDFQKATLIWNAPGKTRQEILDGLKELADTTEDEKTRKQIYERLAFEEKLFSAFIDNSSSKYVYVVEDRYNEFRCGFFADYDRAVKYLLKFSEKYETKCSIKKHPIIKSAEDEIVPNPCRGNPNMGIEFDEYSQYSGEAAAEMSFNKNGAIIRWWSNELPREEELAVSEFRPDRFESAFIKIPFNLQAGTPVKDVVNGNYGILEKGKEEWDDYLRLIEQYADFSDIQVVVYQLTKSGYWSHEHICPMYLDVEFPPARPDDEKREAFRSAMKAFSDYIRHEGRTGSESVLESARAYAKACRKKEYWELALENAKEVEEIMC